MPVAIALIIGVVVLATALIGLLWAMAVLLPFYAYIAAAAFLVVRSERRHADLSASVEREVAAQRRFNEQEMRAWNTSLEHVGEDTLRRTRQTTGATAPVAKLTGFGGTGTGASRANAEGRSASRRDRSLGRFDERNPRKK